MTDSQTTTQGNCSAMTDSQTTQGKCSAMTDSQTTQGNCSAMTHSQTTTQGNCSLLQSDISSSVRKALMLPIYSADKTGDRLNKQQRRATAE